MKNKKAIANNSNNGTITTSSWETNLGYYNMWESPFNIPNQPGDFPYTSPSIVTQPLYNNFIQWEVIKNPECYLTINKSRCKVYNDFVYLKDNTEFEFEIYNPSINTIGVKFKINGKYIDNYLVLYPGKRVFLDCYLNTKNKFKYVTYNVENNNEVLDAIINNGKIEIEFYNEYKEINNTYTYYNSQEPIIYGNSNINLNNNNLNNIETGIVVNGNKSDMEFNNVNTQFALLPYYIQKFNILPISQKPVETKDLINKCKCGTKLKKQFKFCPNCGTIKINYT